MSSLKKFIQNLKSESDIPVDSEVYAEIFPQIQAVGLNLAFFIFQSVSSSYAARTLEGGRTTTCPIIHLYLKYDDDFLKTGIDHHQGNWGDKWPPTIAVRDAVNAVLRKHAFGSDYVSEHTFVFVDTLERIAFLQIGKACKKAVCNLVRRTLPEIKVDHVFWLETRQYVVLFQNKKERKHVNRDTVKIGLQHEVARILAEADTEHYCRNYEVEIEFGAAGMNLFGLTRDGL